MLQNKLAKNFFRNFIVGGTEEMGRRIEWLNTERRRAVVMSDRSNISHSASPRGSWKENPEITFENKHWMFRSRASVCDDSQSILYKKFPRLVREQKAAIIFVSTLGEFPLKPNQMSQEHVLKTFECLTAKNNLVKKFPVPQNRLHSHKLFMS